MRMEKLDDSQRNGAQVYKNEAKNIIINDKTYKKANETHCYNFKQERKFAKNYKIQIHAVEIEIIHEGSR